MSVDRLETIFPPFSMIVDSTKVTVYEVTKSQAISGDKWFHVFLDLQYRKHRSKRFSIDCRNWQDFLIKLIVEISKFKLMVLEGIKV